jgi:glutathione peroxidase
MSAHEFSFPAIDGGSIDLAAFRGRPVLLVNVASECGFTPQYVGLQTLWQRYGERGLVVLGVPSNDFGGQEPGDAAAIRAFCTTTYGVEFPMAAKQSVLGGAAHPLYRWIEDELGEAGAPRWNFHKYLFDGAGELAGMWPSAVTPLAPEITDAIEALLADDTPPEAA